MKVRVDKALVDCGLCETRARAQALIMAGEVFLGERRVEKAGELVAPDAPLRVRERLKYASRAGGKLAGALDALGLSPAGKVCADLGASTGGFTDVLLQRGAARVHAVDVGRGQLAFRLAQDPRVVVHDETNARYVRPELFGGKVDFVTADLSFISLRLVLPAIRSILAPGGLAVLLVKPQFEVGKEQVGKGGVVRDEALRREALQGVIRAAVALGLEQVGHVESSVPGPAGNVEWILALRLPEK